MTAPFDRVDAAHHQRAGDDRADGRRRIQPAVAARADVQHVLREDRQERGRRRKERREEIQQHRRADERRAEHEAQPLERRGDGEVAARAVPPSRRLAARRRHPHHQQRRDHDQKRRGVDGVDPGDAARRDDDAAERRTGDRRHLHHDRVEGDGVRQVLARNEVGHERLPRREVEGAGGGTARRQHVDRPDRRQAVETSAPPG